MKRAGAHSLFPIFRARVTQPSPIRRQPGPIRRRQPPDDAAPVTAEARSAGNRGNPEMRLGLSSAPICNGHFTPGLRLHGRRSRACRAVRALWCARSSPEAAPADPPSRSPPPGRPKLDRAALQPSKASSGGEERAARKVGRRQLIAPCLKPSHCRGQASPRKSSSTRGLAAPPSAMEGLGSPSGGVMCGSISLSGQGHDAHSGCKDASQPVLSARKLYLRLSFRVDGRGTERRNRCRTRIGTRPPAGPASGSSALRCARGR